MSWWEGNGRSEEWYTPRHVFEALDVTFDLDVAASPWGLDAVPALNRLSRNSLDQPWRGFIWMNAPYGGRNGIAPWLSRFFAHRNGIACVPDRTSAPWFHDAWRRSDAILFTRKLRFFRPDGSEGKSPSNGTALMASGATAVAALQSASSAGLGILGKPWRLE